MKTQSVATAIARSLVDTASGAGCPTGALITDMDQPLAPTLGNALEVAIAMEVLAGNRAAAPRLHDLTVALGAELLTLAGIDAGADKIEQAIASGQAMERFARMVAALGGPPDMAEDWHTHLPKAPVVGEVPAPTSGYISAIDGEALGLAVVGMGGGRRVETDRIDPSVGLEQVVTLGTRVNRGDPLCVLHAADEDSAEVAARAVLAAMTIGDMPDLQPLIRDTVD
jgi:thymidine phosphorylase